MSEDKFEKLWETVQPLRKYYYIDKVKSWVVYVYDKDDSKNKDWGLFDIYKNKIVFYTDNHTIIEKAKPIIKKIQKYLEE